MSWLNMGILCAICLFATGFFILFDIAGRDADGELMTGRIPFRKLRLTPKALLALGVTSIGLTLAILGIIGRIILGR